MENASSRELRGQDVNASGMYLPIILTYRNKEIISGVNEEICVEHLVRHVMKSDMS